MSERILTLRSCAVRGPQGAKGDTGGNILRVYVSGMTVEDGSITAGTLSESYDTIRAAVIACRPVELVTSYGDVLCLTAIKQNQLDFGLLIILNPNDFSDGFISVQIAVGSNGIKYGTYYET